MGEIWLGRHGHTAYNSGSQGSLSGELIRGWIDVPLDERGTEEAHQLADLVANSVRPAPRTIWSSDLQRALKTAYIISQKIGSSVGIAQELRPWNLGGLQGTSVREAGPIISKHAVVTPDEPIPGGESFNEFFDRFIGFLQDRISDAEDDDDNQLLVTHYRNLKMTQGHLASLRKGISFPVFLKHDLTRTGELMRVFNANPDWAYQMIS